MQSIVIFFVTFMVSSGGFVAASQDGTGVEWVALHYQAKKLLMKARATIEVDLLDSPALESGLREIPNGQKGISAKGKNLCIRIASDLPFGKFEEESIWIRASTGAALQADKLVSGRKNYRKIQRYGEDGYYQWRSHPENKAEKKLEPASWSMLSTEFFPFQPKPGNAMAVSDSSTLIFQIAAARLDLPGAQMKTVINVKGELVELVFTARNLEKLKAQWIDTTSSATEEVVKLNRQAQLLRRVTATATQLSKIQEDADVDIGFLGIQGNLEVFVLEGDGTPAIIVGKTKRLGEIRVKLMKREFDANCGKNKEAL